LVRDGLNQFNEGETSMSMLHLDGRNLYYDLVGPESGQVVCFGHSLASDSGMWAEQIPVLVAAGYQVLRVDMRGHGGSSTVLPTPYKMEDIADDTAAVISALGLGKVHYIGLSIGGMYGQALGFRHVDKVRSLMLCDTRPAAPAGEAERRAPVIAAVRKANSLLPMVDEAMDRWFTPAFKQRRPGRWKQIRETLVGTSPEGYIGCAIAIQNFNFIAQDPGIKAPTLVMRGSEDKGATREQADHLLKLIPNSKFDEIAGGRHVSNVEFDDVFNRMMMGWLNANR
jgi:3-oxoadipate enol-lactonase